MNGSPMKRSQGTSPSRCIRLSLKNVTREFESFFIQSLSGDHGQFRSGSYGVQNHHHQGQGSPGVTVGVGVGVGTLVLVGVGVGATVGVCVGVAVGLGWCVSLGLGAGVAFVGRGVLVGRDVGEKPGVGPAMVGAAVLPCCGNLGSSLRVVSGVEPAGESVGIGRMDTGSGTWSASARGWSSEITA